MSFALLAIMAASAIGAPKTVPLPGVVKGANLRPVGDPRRGYGTKTAAETLERMKKLGVNTIAVLMEGRMDEATSIVVRGPDEKTRERTRAMLEDANRLGLATILVPHLYLDDGRWRGEIAFWDPPDRDAWWASYREFIEGAAAIASASAATVLTIGVELKAMSKAADTRARMLALAAHVRGLYGGLLAYDANWDEAEEVAFWDAVDVAGVNGYYPLLPDPERGAEAIARRLRTLSKIAKKDVLVLEVGYRSSPLSHVRPWEWPSHVPEIVDDASQAKAYAAVLTHWLDAPGIRGLLFWVVPTDPDDPASEPRHGFNPLNKPAEEVIRRAFLREKSG